MANTAPKRFCTMYLISKAETIVFPVPPLPATAMVLVIILLGAYLDNVTLVIASRRRERSVAGSEAISKVQLLSTVEIASSRSLH